MTSDLRKAPEVYPFGSLTMPAETVEHLGNGVVFHRYSGGDQPVCNLTLHFAGGTSEMGEAVCKLLLSMLTEGTSTSSADDIAEAIDFNGARFSTQAHTHHSVVELAVLNSRLGEILPVLGDIIVNSSFPADRLEVARVRLKNTIHTIEHTPSAVASQGLSTLICGAANPLSKVMTEADVDAVDSSRLLSTHRRMVAPGRINAYLSGLLDDGMVSLVRNFLQAIPVLGEGFDFEYHLHEPQPAGAVVTAEMAGTLQSAIACGIPTIDRRHADYIPLRYTIMALGGYFGSRLMSNIREDKGLTYGISASLLGAQDGAQVYVGTLTDRSNTEVVIGEIRKEMAAMATNPPCGDELHRFRTYAMTGLAELLDSPLSVMQYYGSQNLVGTPKDYFEAQLKVLQTITSDDMSRLSAKYLDPTALRISIVK